MALGHIKEKGDLQRVLYRYYNSDALEQRRSAYTTSLFESAEILKRYGGGRDQLKLNLYQSIIRLLDELELSPELRQKVTQHEERLNKKIKWGIVISIIAALFLLLKLLGSFLR